MTRTLSTADGTLAWEDAREGDFIRVNETRHEVKYTRIIDGLYANRIGIYEWQDQGGILERDVPVHPLENAEPGTVIYNPDEEQIYERWGSGIWVTPGHTRTFTTDEIILIACDGYEILWPRPVPPVIEAGQVWRHEDGRTWEATCPNYDTLTDVWWGRRGNGVAAIATANGLLAAGFRLDTSKEDEQ